MDSTEAAEKTLAEAYPEMLELLAAAIDRGTHGTQIFTFHLCEGEPSRFQSDSSYTKKLN